MEHSQRQCTTCMSPELYEKIERSEALYMVDRMQAIQESESNREGVELRTFGHTFVYYSKTMPWPQFNTVKCFSDQDGHHLDAIIDFFKSRKRAVQFEMTPGTASKNLFAELASRGLYQSGFHSSLYARLGGRSNHPLSHQPTPIITIRPLRNEEFDVYAMIHCRGSGLPDNGIPHVSRNNRVLFDRPGWHFFLAEVNHDPAAVGVMYINNTVASLTFAATLPKYRERGLHTALIRHRIEQAAQAGCELVVGQASYASQSYRNMEKVGMTLAYTRATWTELELSPRQRCL